MINPYQSSIVDSQISTTYRQALEFAGRFLLGLGIFFVVDYCVSLPGSKLWKDDVWMVVLSPVLPISFVTSAITENMWINIASTILPIPIAIGLATLFCKSNLKQLVTFTACLGIVNGLILRLFLTLCDIAPI